MRKLIHVVAALLAGLIQKGSLRNAAIGSIIGIVVVWLLVWMLRAAGVFDAWISFAIPGSLLAGFAGAVVGSRVPPRRPVGLVDGEPVTVWNLNHALVPIAVPLILGGVFTFAMFAASHSAKDPVPVIWGWLVLAATSVIVATAAHTVTYGLRLGEEIRLLKLRRSRAYQRGEVIRWGFEITRGRLTPTPPNTASCLIVQFADGKSFACEVSSATAERVAYAMKSM